MQNLYWSLYIWLDNLEMGHATKTVIVKEEKKFENLNLKPYTVI